MVVVSFAFINSRLLKVFGVMNEEMVANIAGVIGIVVALPLARTTAVAVKSRPTSHLGVLQMT